MDTYPVELGALLDELGAERVIEDEVDLGEFTVGDVTFVPEAAASFGVSLTNTGAGVVGDGWVRESVRTECSRCLEPCTVEISGTVEAFYVTPAHVEGVPEEQEYELIHEGRIDLGNALRGALAIEAPYAPLHDADCKGICPSCGVNLNVDTCECHEDAHPENPFAVLQDLFAAEDDEAAETGVRQEPADPGEE